MSLPASAASTPDFDWLQQAACRGSDTALFFPSRGDNRRLQKAKSICAQCGVRQQCLQYSLDMGLHMGIYGGLSERQRRTIRRRKPSSC